MANYIIDATMRLRDNFTGKLEKAQTKIQNNTKVLNKFSYALKKASSQIVALGNTLTKSLTLPLTALGTTSVVSFANFESAMLGVQNVTRATKTELEQLENLALSLASSTSKSAVECANGIEYLGLAGWGTQEIMDNYADILRLCESTNIDLALASDLVTDSLSAYGKTADFTSEYLNTLTLVSTRANANTQQLLESIVVCGGMAKNLNLNIGELSSTLGVLANRGIKGAEAGTSLNSIFVNLLGTTSTTRNALKFLGVEVYDIQGRFVGWNNLLEQLSVTMSRCTDEQRDMLASALGGKTQLDTLLALLDGYNNEYHALLNGMGEIYTFDELGNQITVLEQMQKDYQDTILGKFEILKSQINFIFIKIGDVINRNFGGALDRINGKVEHFINWCKSLTEEQRKNIIQWGMFATAIAPVLLLVGNLTGHISKGVRTIVTFSKAVENAGGLIKLWQSPLGLLRLKILLVVGVIALLVVGIIKLVNWWRNLEPSTQAVIKSLGGVITAIGGIITAFSLFMTGAGGWVGVVISLIVGLVGGIIANWDKVKDWTINTWNTICSFITTVWSVIKDVVFTVVGNIASYIISYFRSIYQTISGILISIQDFIINGVASIMQIFSGLIDFIAGVFTGNWARAWEGVKNIFGGIWSGLVNLVKTPLNIIIDLVNSVIRSVNSLGSFKLPAFLGGKSFELFTIPQIPKLYTGTQNWGGGYAMIHDRGGEIVDLPRGTRVYPHDKSVQMAYNQGRSERVQDGNIVIEKIADVIKIREDADINKIINQLVAKLGVAELNKA